MSDIRTLAREMAGVAINEGSKIAYDTAISFCEKLSQAYAMRGDQASTTAAQECANGIKALRAHIDIRDAANETGGKADG